MGEHDATKRGRANGMMPQPTFGNAKRRRLRRGRANRGWSVCASAVTTVGLLCGQARWGWQGVTTGILILALLVTVFTAALFGVVGLRALSRLSWVGLVMGTCLVALTAVVAVFGAIGFLVVLLLVGSSPTVVAVMRVLWHSVMNRFSIARPDVCVVQAHATREDIELPRQVAMTAEKVSTLDDAALCLAWRRSFVVLEAAVSIESRMTVVQQRQVYLDELERRCPGGIAAWLSSGARASGNPLPYMGDRPHRSV